MLAIGESRKRIKSMFCKNCGRESQSGMAFCQSCGAKVGEIRVGTSTTNGKCGVSCSVKKGLMWIVGIIVALLILGVMLDVDISDQSTKLMMDALQEHFEKLKIDSYLHVDCIEELTLVNEGDNVYNGIAFAKITLLRGERKTITLKYDVRVISDGDKILLECKPCYEGDLLEALADAGFEEE